MQWSWQQSVWTVLQLLPLLKDCQLPQTDNWVSAPSTNAEKVGKFLDCAFPILGCCVERRDAKFRLAKTSFDTNTHVEKGRILASGVGCHLSLDLGDKKDGF